jgi:hypothetical protein
MSDRRFLKPARPGLRVRDPDHGGALLPAEGAMCNWSTYWYRRVADGDVVEAPAPAEDSAVPAEAASESSSAKGRKSRGSPDSP